MTSCGDVVWEYLNPFGGDVPASFGRAAGARNQGPDGVDAHALFRATRLAPDHPALRDRDL